MSKEIGRYCTETQMFVEPVREPSIGHLKMLRFQADRGDFGIKPLSMPKGDYLFRLSDAEIVEHVARDNRRKAMSQYEQTIR